MGRDNLPEQQDRKDALFWLDEDTSGAGQNRVAVKEL